MRSKILLFYIFGFMLTYAFENKTSGFPNPTVHPNNQVVNEYESVSITCTDSDEFELHWMRAYGKPIPPKAKQLNGTLYIKSIRKADAGVYLCVSRDTTTNFSKRVSAVVGVNNSNLSYNNLYHKTKTAYSYTTPSWNKLGVHSNEKKNHVDLNEDIKRPKITLLPKQKIEVFCGDQEPDKAGVLILECEFTSNPEPLIKWKKYEGHVPSKCQQSSNNGHGILKCPNFQQSDQGAYSCVAENLEKSSESQPKSIAKCSNSVRCNGFRVLSSEKIETCLECFCSGKSSQCTQLGSNLTVTKIPFPQTETEIFAVKNGEIVFVPSQTRTVPSEKIRSSASGITYCSLSKEEFAGTSFLKSYGRNINIPRHKGKIEFFPEAPDIIIQGNGRHLMYKFNVISHSAEAVDIRFWPGNWHHLNKTIAKRSDIMKVLSNMESLFFRCEYKEGNILNLKSAKIYVESSVITSSKSSVSYVEKCTCPIGYDGLSCELCAPGYKKKIVGDDFVCETNEITKSPIYPTECDKTKNYYKKNGECVKATCNLDGSISPEPDFFGKCTCKEGITGKFCDKCETGFFNFQSGCTKCWCNNAAIKCSSSNWIRTIISSMSLGGYNSSDGRNFWLLPEVFSGNRLTSYGGYLNYTMKYARNIPKQEYVLTVELLTLDNITLSYSHSNTDKTSTYEEKSWSVKLVEKNWKKSNKDSVTRGEFLAVLAKIKAVYIESPYHLSSGFVNLTAVRMSSAQPRGIGETAIEVEQCNCIEGYEGLSCETCSQGYYKSRNGTSFKCLKCNCPFCDPERGCTDCPTGSYRENPMHEPDPVCKPCPCNKNEISCYKDNYQQIFCRCKPGFMGIHCEKVPQNENKSFIKIKISPKKVKSQKVGTKVRFTCSYGSDEELNVKIMEINSKGLQRRIEDIKELIPEVTYNSTKNFEITLSNDLKSIECFVYDKEDTEVGRVKAVIDDLITDSVPVEIKNCYTDIIDLLENEERDLRCEAVGSPIPTVNWFRTTHKRKMEKVDTTAGIHSIRPTDSILENNGTIYTCIAENIEGGKAMCNKVLLVQKKCDPVYVEPKFIRVVEGDKFQLKCTTTTNSSVTWHGPKYSLPIFRQKLNGGILEIMNSTVDDSGTYTCQAQVDSRYINKTVSVIVEEKKIPPTVFIPDNDAVLKVGDNFEVTCTASGKPIPKVSWVKTNEILPSNIVVDNKRLKIKEATLKNSGIYECRGVSPIGNATAYIYIKVKDNSVVPKVEIIPRSPIKVNLNEQLSVQCVSKKGHPKPALEWWKETISYDWTKVTDTGIMSFRNIQFRDSGKYKCIGKNSLGQDEEFTKIDVQQPPKVNISEEKITCLANEEVTLTCLALGHPEPQIVWVNPPPNSTSTISRNEVVSIEPLKLVKLVLTFKATKSLNGIAITCSAENQAGRNNKTATVIVLEQTVYGNPETAELAPLGSPFELHCQPPSGNVTWEKVGGQMEGHECPIPNGLLIPSVQIQHAGKYICRSTSKTDLKFEKTFILEVVGFVPKFTQTQKSYLILPVKLKSANEVRIQISFKTEAETGLLLHKRKQEMELHLKKGKVHLYLSSKIGTHFQVSGSKSIKLGKWYSITVEISKTYVDITVYDENTFVLERITEYFEGFNFTFYQIDNFIVGGSMPDNMMMAHSHMRLFSHLPSFDGCVSKLNIDSHDFDLVKEGSFSHRAQLCKECSKEVDPCQGKGKCFDAPTQYGFICACPDSIRLNDTCPASCIGKGCETELDLCKKLNPCKRSDLHECMNNLYSLQCNCAHGYSGTTCEKAEQFSFCVKNNGFVRLPGNLIKRGIFESPEIIRINFTLLSPNGVLLWQGHDKNFLLIAVVGSHIVYVYYTQGVQLSIVSPIELPLLNKLSMTTTRKNDTVFMEVRKGSDLLFKFSNSSTFVTNRVQGDIYLGNVPSSIRHSDKRLSGLNGCIHSISFGNKSIINLDEYALERMNIVNTPAEVEFDTDSYDSEDIGEYDTD